jgi:hypothetical protein
VRLGGLGVTLGGCVLLSSAGSSSETAGVMSFKLRARSNISRAFSGSMRIALIRNSSVRDRTPAVAPS